MKKLPHPNGPMLRWLMENPEAIPEAINSINLLLNMESKVVPGSTYVQGRAPAIPSSTNFILPIPIGFNVKVTAISDYTAVTFGATYNATVQSNLNALSKQVDTMTKSFNALILALQQANINPR